MAANTAETESRFRMGIRNKYGYSGLYQFGGEALAEIGYMKRTGGGWRQQNEAMRNPSNWLNGLSLQKFLSSRELQDKAYVALVNKNLQYGRGMGGEKFQQLMKDYRQVAKYAKMAHLKGTGNAVKGLLYGRDAADGNGTSMIAYGNKAAANVDAILKAMGDGKPVSNAKSDNPAFRLGQQAGEGVRNAASKVYNKVTGNTPTAPAAPATRYPTSMEAFTAMAPGEDCAIAIRSSISCSSIQFSSSTKRLRINGTITNPPPKVQALSFNVEKNNVLYIPVSTFFNQSRPSNFHSNIFCKQNMQFWKLKT